MIIKKRGDFFLVLLFAIILVPGFGQYKFQSVFKGLSGAELLTKLVQNYKPGVVLDYGQAKDTLYARIYNEHDTVYGVYTRYGLYLPAGVDPSSYLYNGGSGINAEHTFPRSKGAAEGNAKSDMHHLFPAKVNVNEKRGSLPFNDIDDNLTNDWYYKNIVLHHIPEQNIDAYSEGMPQYFEPREDHKGNVARAMFYFYTMYKSEADKADKNYFKRQRETLCRWHFQDPVDSLEWVRTWQIAKYQEGKPNPFVLDCSLASRTYCDFISDACKTAGTGEIWDNEVLHMVLFPVPAGDMLNVRMVNPGIKKVLVTITDMLGNTLYCKPRDFDTGEIEKFSIKIQDFKKGNYILNVRGIEGNHFINAYRLFSVQ